MASSPIHAHLTAVETRSAGCRRTWFARTVFVTRRAWGSHATWFYHGRRSSPLVDRLAVEVGPAALPYRLSFHHSRQADVSSAES
jgi:hypothetical protein